MLHPPGAVSQARLLDNQEGASSANTERYIRVRKVFSRRHFSNADLFFFLAPVALFKLLWRYPPWKIDPGGGVVYTVVCVTAVVLSCTQPTGSGAQFFSNVGFGENRSEDGQSREYVHRSQGAKGRVLHTKP